jgi:hypothetical protein
MKNKIYFLLTVLMITCAVSAFAQGPPPTPNGSNGDPTTSGNRAVNGPSNGAPIGSGVLILLVLGTGYGAKKVYTLRNKPSAL